MHTYLYTGDPPPIKKNNSSFSNSSHCMRCGWCFRWGRVMLGRLAQNFGLLPDFFLLPDFVWISSWKLLYLYEVQLMPQVGCGGRVKLGISLAPRASPTISFRHPHSFYALGTPWPIVSVFWFLAFGISLALDAPNRLCFGYFWYHPRSAP